MISLLLKAFGLILGISLTVQVMAQTKDNTYSPPPNSTGSFGLSSGLDALGIDGKLGTFSLQGSFTRNIEGWGSSTSWSHASATGTVSPNEDQFCRAFAKAEVSLVGGYNNYPYMVLPGSATAYAATTRQLLFAPTYRVGDDNWFEVKAIVRQEGGGTCTRKTKTPQTEAFQDSCGSIPLPLETLNIDQYMPTKFDWIVDLPISLSNQSFGDRIFGKNIANSRAYFALQAQTNSNVEGSIDGGTSTSYRSQTITQVEGDFKGMNLIPAELGADGNLQDLSCSVNEHPRLKDQCFNLEFIFINGILTSWPDAIDNVVAIRKSLEKIYDGNSEFLPNSLRTNFEKVLLENRETPSVRLAYNATFGIFNDLIESLRQRNQLVPRDLIRGTVRIFERGQSFFTRKEGQTNIRGEVVNELLAVLKKSLEPGFATTGLFPYSLTIANLADKVSSRVKQGDTRVILISHSQGNYFANDVYRVLDRDLQKSVRQIGFAVPGNKDKKLPVLADGKGRFITFFEDMITITGSEGNLAHDGLIDPLHAHFLDAYMKDRGSQSLFTDHLRGAWKEALCPRL